MTLSTNYNVQLYYHSFEVQVRNKVLLLNCDYGMYVSSTHRYKGGFDFVYFNRFLYVYFESIIPHVILVILCKYVYNSIVGFYFTLTCIQL